MGNLARTRKTNYSVKWNGVDMGYCDKVSPDIKLKFKPIKVGSIGDIDLGDRMSGLDGKITIEFREVDFAAISKMLPWYVSGTKAQLAPTVLNADLYQYAQALVLHPLDIAAATLTEDVTFTKAVPISGYKLDRDGDKDDVFAVEFKIYPDRAQLPVIDYGYVGF